MRTFVTDDGAVYSFTYVTESEANQVGCPEATARVTGKHETTYVLTLGKGRCGVRVRTNGWRDKTGRRMHLVDAADGKTFDTKGFLLDIW